MATKKKSDSQTAAPVQPVRQPKGLLAPKKSEPHTVGQRAAQKQRNRELNERLCREKAERGGLSKRQVARAADPEVKARRIAAAKARYEAKVAREQALAEASEKAEKYKKTQINKEATRKMVSTDPLAQTGR